MSLRLHPSPIYNNINTVLLSICSFRVCVHSVCVYVFFSVSRLRFERQRVVVDSVVDYREVLSLFGEKTRGLT